MNAEELFKSGDIAGARAALAAELKRSPQDVRARQFFWQLLAIVGDLDKSDAQLKALGNVQASAMMMGSVYMQAINAERLRARTFAGEIAPKSLVGVEPWVQGLLGRCARLKVAVALANKMARIAWAVMAKGESYRRTVTA